MDQSPNQLDHSGSELDFGDTSHSTDNTQDLSFDQGSQRDGEQLTQSSQAVSTNRIEWAFVCR